MKKKSYTGRLAAVAVVLCLVTMSLTSGTLARYASEASGNAVATVAKWNIKFTDGADTPVELSSNFTLNLKDTAKETSGLVAEDRIAPGTTGAFKLGLTAEGTEVPYDYVIEFDMSSDALKAAPLKFFDGTTELTPGSDGKVKLEGSVALADVDTAVSKEITWKWDSTEKKTTVDSTEYTSTGTDDDGGTNEVDTSYGKSAATAELKYTIPVTITAVQKTA